VKPRRKYTVAELVPRIERFLGPIIERARLRLCFHISDGAVKDRDWECPELMVTFSGPDVDLLLENKAELLLALEHLAVQMLRVPSEDHEKICFDARDYRMLRIEELRLSALAAAERVRRSGKPFQFSPMTSRERRIIHLALRDEAGILSQSQGIGPGRHVVVYPVSERARAVGPPPSPQTPSSAAEGAP